MFKKQKKDKLETNFNNAEIMAEESNLIRCYNENAGHPIKTLLGLYSRHKGTMTVSTVFFLLKSLPALIFPKITANIINAVTYSPDDIVKVFIMNGVLVVVLLLGNFFTNMVHLKAFNKTKRTVEASLRGAMVRKMQQLSISFHKETASGKIQSKIMRDVEAVEGLSSQIFTSVIAVILNFAITLSIVFSKNVFIFFVILISAPAAALLTNKFRGNIRQTSHNFRKEMEEVSSEVMDMVE